MPYINDEFHDDEDGRREELHPTGKKRAPFIALNPGELNFQITMACSDYLCFHKYNYESINAVIGALECAKLELYARIARPYEDKKIIQNGDVYPKQLDALPPSLTPKTAGVK